MNIDFSRMDLELLLRSDIAVVGCTNLCTRTQNKLITIEMHGMAPVSLGAIYRIDLNFFFAWNVICIFIALARARLINFHRTNTITENAFFHQMICAGVLSVIFVI